LFRAVLSCQFSVLSFFLQTTAFVGEPHFFMIPNQENLSGFTEN